MHAIINDEPQPLQEHGAGDASLWRVVKRGLTKDRDVRWANMTELGEALALWLYEHGIKEDLSGNSIRAVWLDGALSGVRPDVNSTMPPLSGKMTAESSIPTRQPLAQTQASNRSTRRSARQKNVFLIALALGVGLGGIGVALALGGRHEGPRPVASTASPTTIHSVSSAPVVPSASAAESMPSPVESASAKSADVAVPADVIGMKHQPGKAAAQKSPNRPPRRSHDFGF